MPSNPMARLERRGVPRGAVRARLESPSVVCPVSWQSCALLCTVSVNVRSNTLCTAPPRTTMHIDMSCASCQNKETCHTHHTRHVHRPTARDDNTNWRHMHMHITTRARAHVC